MKRRQKFSPGFTLIEILIAMAIFAFIATGTGAAVIRGIQVKKRVETEWEKTHGIRTALRVLERDIYLAFHQKQAKSPFGFRPSDQDLWFKSFFKGKEDHVAFTSSSHRRIIETAHESDLCEIGYELTSDPEILNQKNLTRRLAVTIDDQPEKGGKSQILLENVKELKFRYFSSTKEKWVEDWDTDHSEFGDNFPDAVEIKLTVVDKSEEIHYETIAIIANPNNVEPKEKGAEDKDKEPDDTDTDKDKDKDKDKEKEDDDETPQPPEP